MTKVVAPSLDELLTSENPAWLWDGERARIVWANAAGTSWFGVETLFDLLEVVFDTSEPGVASIKDLSSRLPRGESATVSLTFADVPTGRQLDCTCYVHALADGRTGLLVCADSTTDSAEALPAAVQAMALGAFPLPICVVTGGGQVIFSNEALQEILPTKSDYGFARDLIEKSFAAGSTSGLKSLKTKHGKRDIRIIVQPLEKADRLADASFLLVLEDVTERRTLERSLLAAAERATDDQLATPENTDAPAPTAAIDEPVSKKVSEPSVDNEVVKALNSLRLEIEKQTSATVDEKPAAQQVAPAQKEVANAEKEVATKDESETDAAVPDIVSSTLNSLPQPLVLIDQAGTVLFANDVVVELMGVKTWQEIAEITTLGDALTALEGEDGAISLFTAKDEPINLDVIISTFPWKDGPVFQATLSPGSDGEEADNRRAVDGKKKTKKLRQ